MLPGNSPETSRTGRYSLQISGVQTRKCTWENATAFAYDAYERFQKREQTVAVATDLVDAYNRVQFKLLMDLLIQYRVSLTLTRWVAGALLERTVVMRLGNWSSAPHQLTMGLMVSMGVSLVVPSMTRIASFCTLSSCSRFVCATVVRPSP